MSATWKFIRLAVVAVVAQEAQAQRTSLGGGTIAWRVAERHTVVLAAQPQRDEKGAFVLEAVGGSLGSLVGIGAVGLATRCGVDDLACGITSVGVGGVLGVVGATVGTIAVARHFESPRSVVGAALGAVVGTGVGLGVHYVLNRNSDRNLGDAVVVPVFVLSQGILAAVGSRVAARRS